MDPFLLSFNHRGLESRFQAYYARRLRSLDVRSSLMATVACFALICRACEVQPGWGFAGWVGAVAHTLVLAPAPAAWALARQDSWGKWRRVWLGLYIPYAFRVSAILMRDLHLVRPASGSKYLLWNAFNYSNVGWQVVLSLLYRLPFTSHLATHALVVAVLQMQNGDWCRWLEAARPGMLAALRSRAQHGPFLYSLAPARQGAALDAAAREAVQGQRVCLAALSFAQIYVGFGLASYLVWLLERQARHTFVLQMRAGTASVTPPQLFKKVGRGTLVRAGLAVPATWGLVKLLLRFAPA